MDRARKDSESENIAAVVGYMVVPKLLSDASHGLRLDRLSIPPAFVVEVARSETSGADRGTNPLIQGAA